VLAFALVIPVVLTQFLAEMRNPANAILASIAFLLIQVSIGRALTPTARHGLIRLAAALLYVTLVARMGSADGVPSLLILYTPIIVLAAALGRAHAFVIGGAAVIGYLVPVLLDPVHDPFLRERAIVLISMTAALSIGTRQAVSSLERASLRMRSLLRTDRQRARRLAAIEETGHLLAEYGPGDVALAGIMDLLTDRMGYGHASLYLGNEHLLRLAVQRGYDDPIPSFVPDMGVLGRVMRTRTAALIVDVGADPDYVQAKDVVQSLISVPLIASDEVIGAINVESSPPHRLSADDLATVCLVADRLALALALAADRERLKSRALRFERLTALAHELTATLDLDELEAAIARAVSFVVPSDLAILRVADPIAGSTRQSEWRQGEGPRIADAAIEELTEHAMRVGGPVVVGGTAAWPIGCAAAVPLLRGEEVVGAIGLVRAAPDSAFDPLEHEVLPLVASQIALAIANAQLHSAAREASIRDPLTGLHNRRYLDAAIASRSASRARTSPESREPVSVVLFDLDHFGRFNKDYGHALGDEVLRRFGEILTARARASDLVARFGGEEFVAVLAGAGRDGARRFAEDVRQRLEQLHVDDPSGGRVRATVSAGVSTAGEGTTAIEPLFALADVGLAMAKHAGRNTVIEA